MQRIGFRNEGCETASSKSAFYGHIPMSPNTVQLMCQNVNDQRQITWISLGFKSFLTHCFAYFKIHISSPACTLRCSLRELLLKFPRPMYSLNTFSPNNHAEAVNLSTWVQKESVHNSPGYRQLCLTCFIIYLDALKFNFNKLLKIWTRSNFLKYF
jgi:hypothetical protein